MAVPEFVVLAVDAAIVVIAIECVVVARWPGLVRRAGRASALANLGAGACLMLALRAALVDASWPWIVVPLTLSGAAHAFDWRARWRRGASIAP